MAQSTNKPTILTVDDEVSIQKSIKRCLRKLDAKVLMASSGEEALEIMSNQTVDVILSDMRMPGMSGAQFFAQARATQPKAKRILLTGYSDMESAIQAINEGGVSTYLNKPWDDDQLRDIVTEALKVSLLARENDKLKDDLEAKNQQLAAINEDLERRVEERTAQLEQSNNMLNQSVTELGESYDTMVDLLASLAALPDTESNTASQKVELADTIAELMELDDEQRQALKYATRLHRIGWAALPKRLHQKSFEQMSEAELSDFESHVAYADALLMGVPKLRSTREILRFQHERWDGLGYPDRVATNGIPITSVILAVARDYYDYQSGRMTGDSLSPGDASKEVEDRVDKAYASEVLPAFKEAVKQLGMASAALLDQRIEARLLQPGMKLSRDLHTQNGAALLNKGALLTEQIITTIINLETRSDQQLAIYVAHDQESP